MNINLLIVLLTGLGLLLIILVFYFKKKKPVEKIEGDYFESTKGPLYYKVIGNSGPALLLVHGLGSSIYCWRHLIKLLKDDFQIVAVDLWGFGNSSKYYAAEMNLDDQIQTLMSLMDHLNIKSFHLVGHSMGGHISLWLARNHLNRILKVVAIAPASHPKVAPSGIEKLFWMANWTPWFLNRNLIRRVLKRVITDHSLITNDMIEAYYTPYRDPDAHLSFAAAIKMINDGRVFDQLEYIDKPALLLWGEKDHVINKKTIQQINEKLPNSSLETSPRSNHMPMEDDVQWLYQQIVSFLKS